MQNSLAREQLLTTGINKLNPTVNNCSTKQVNFLLKDLDDLISSTYKDWYALKFYSLKPETIQRYASQARADGKQPAKLFSYLLKKA